MGFFTTENFKQAFALYIERLAPALFVTSYVTIGAVLIGLSLGLVLALARLSSSVTLSRTTQIIISVLRTIPVPPFLYLVYFSIISTFFPIEPALAGTLALGILLTPYMAEVYRAGIQNVKQGQIEAARALGMPETLVRRRVILPLAIRLMLPAIGAQVVVTLLNSAFVAVMGGKDITGMSRNIIYAWFTSELYFVVALTYFIISYPLSRGLAWLERRLTLNL